ncbi:MAG: patatin-like phospholipase family protein, partial [Bdellovibrionales bacterium]|nr:patatin-like phospholipase family protein [Bdellovibrionales bacterium]
MRLSEKKKPSLVLSGGGVKAAAFHIGVCLALREKGFKFAGGSPSKVLNDFAENEMTFKTYVGSSAGSIIATLLASGFSVESLIEAFAVGAGITNKRWINSGKKLRPLTYRDIFALNISSGHPSRLFPSFFNKKPLITGGLEVLLKQGFKVNGLFSTRNIEKYLRENVVEDNYFSSLGVDLFIIATQLNHSRKVVFGNFEQTTKTEEIKYANYAQISHAVAASTSLPPAFAPYKIPNDEGLEKYFFDGEIRDTLSTHVPYDFGSDLIIASYSIQPYHYNPEIGSLNEFGIPAIINQALYQVVEQKISTHRKHIRQLRSLINAVDGYLKEINLPTDQREKLLDILLSKTDFKPEVDTIYIHPNPKDYKFFFYDHFSLNPNILARIVQKGF